MTTLHGARAVVTDDDEDDCQTTFAEKLIQLMNTRGTRGKVSQQALADRLGLTRAAINDWCRGRAVPAPETVFAIEEALGVSGGELSETLGYLPLSITRATALTVPEAIARDPHLDDHARGLLTLIYENLARGASSGGSGARR